MSKTNYSDAATTATTATTATLAAGGILLTILIVAGIFALVALCLGFGGLIGGSLIWLAWNFGVVTVCGAPHLAYWPAFFIALGISFIGGCFRAVASK